MLISRAEDLQEDAVIAFVKILPELRDIQLRGYRDLLPKAEIWQVCTDAVYGDGEYCIARKTIDNFNFKYTVFTKIMYSLNTTKIVVEQLMA